MNDKVHKQRLKAHEETSKVHERMSKVFQQMSKVCERMSKVHERTLKVREQTSKVREQTSKVASKHRQPLANLDNIRMFGTNIASLGRHSTNILTTIEGNDGRRETYGKLAQCVPF